MKDGRVEDQEYAMISVLRVGCKNRFPLWNCWKTLTSPWLEKLLPFELHFEMAIIIDSSALKFPTALKEQLPTRSEDDHVINLVEYWCIKFCVF